MESDNPPQLTSPVKCCDCDCNCSTVNAFLPEAYLRSVKRKYDEFEEKEAQFTIPGFVIPQNARVEIGNECDALREMVNNQQQTIEELISELEEQRNASSTATSEAMSMILRLQREKAEIQMEAKQFKRFAEEKMAHDQEEILELDDLVYKREQVIQSLKCEVQAYKHRMMSFGLTESEIDGENGVIRNMSMNENLEEEFEFPPYELYPPLKCNSNQSQGYLDNNDEGTDIEKYPFLETPHSRDQLKDLEDRINQLEKSPRTIHPEAEFTGTKNVLEKVINGQSPKETSQYFVTNSPKFGGNFKKDEVFKVKEDSHLNKVDSVSDDGDDTSDRVYTIDSIHQGASITNPGESLYHSDVKDLEVQKLYARLHALEADRESMRQSIMSIGTEKAQLVLLREIAQNLCKEMAPERRMPLRKQSVVPSFSFVSIFKWVVSFVFWRRNTRRCKYMFGLSPHNVGMLMLLDRGPRVGQWRCISNSHARNS